MKNILKITVTLSMAALFALNPLKAEAVTYVLPDGSMLDPDYYVNTYNDLEFMRGNINGLVAHYTAYGKAEGRKGYDQSDPGEIVTLGAAAPVNPAASANQGTGKQTAATEETVVVRDIKYKDNGVSVLFDDADMLRKRTRSDAEVASYLAGSVFIGDSITLGFRNYAAKKTADPVLGTANFLCGGSFSAAQALRPVSSDSTHPIFRGQKRLLTESLSMIPYSRIYIMLGMNDIAPYGLEGSRDNYMKLITSLKAVSPEAGVTILGMTYTLAGEGKGRLNNDNIRKYNALLKEMAYVNGWDYIDMADILSDGKGNLLPSYCSDGFVHQSYAAYDKWMEVLYAYGDMALETRKAR